MCDVDINMLTMEQYLALNRGNYALSVVNLRLGTIILGVSHDVIMLRIFSITLTGAARRWINKITSRIINTWDLLKKAFIQRRINNGSLDGIVAITSKIDSLGRYMNKLKENVHVIEVDMVEDFRIQIILGRPLLATAHAKIDVYKKLISIEEEIDYRCDTILDQGEPQEIEALDKPQNIKKHEINPHYW
uniref:Reverse transcriptase domain-containing protein n=1 Tax=Tanacetum cinerariifolium TaxID=118510 RepID=A0A699I4C5_TANCI|nr:hypothetical protein [Tanacetum cinerariifolium]